MMIAVIVLIAVLVIFIALLCVRFTLLAKIEDDYREIGVMRAIGLRVSSIGHIYLAVYAALAATGSLLGYLLALLLQDPLRESIRLNLGDGANEAAALLLGAAGAIGIFLLVLLCALESAALSSNFRRAGPAFRRRISGWQKPGQTQLSKKSLASDQPFSRA